jgi:hypothetical protein
LSEDQQGSDREHQQHDWSKPLLAPVMEELEEFEEDSHGYK